MVYRIYVEKKNEFAHEAGSLLSDIKGFLGIAGVEKVRVINRYDVENIDEALFENCINTVFSEPQLDNTSKTLETDGANVVFAVEFLPAFALHTKKDYPPLELFYLLHHSAVYPRVDCILSN